MKNMISTKHLEFISNLKINLELVEVFFKYLQFEKKGKLKYSLTYFYHDSLPFYSILEIITEIERCILHQTSEKNEIEIPAEIVFEQTVIINNKEINLFYHGQLFIYESTAFIYWNWYQGSPFVDLKLNEIIPPGIILSLFENFHTAIYEIKSNCE